jgi:hypothetical protein
VFYPQENGICRKEKLCQVYRWLDLRVGEQKNCEGVSIKMKTYGRTEEFE